MSGGPENPPAPPRRSTGKPLRVLIAHQSTIPHYRVRFYELLEQLRPPDWTFQVVFDPAERQKPRVYEEPVDHLTFKFPLFETPTTVIPLGKRRLIWQHFIRHLKNVDVLVTDTHLSNLSYPAGALLAKARGCKWVLWGHVGNRNLEEIRLGDSIAEILKKRYIARSDAFFAYTDGEKARLLEREYDPTRIRVLNNTIDIQEQRAHFLTVRDSRPRFREDLGFSGKTVLLHIGRLIPGKRIDFLVETFRKLYAVDPKFHLAVIGSGTDAALIQALQTELGPSAVSCPGAITKTAELGKWLVGSDAFIMPGYVGLAPLQAICYDLPVLYFDLPVHSPEVEYLNEVNSVRLPGTAVATEAAQHIRSFMERKSANQLKDGADREPQTFSSIEHLRLETMALRFIEGISKCL